MLNLQPIGLGALALTHRPRKSALAAWRALGVTHVITLLSEREGARELGVLVEAAGLAWIWCPLEGGDVRTPVSAVDPSLAAGAAALASGGKVVVHCSAGIHRTGMFGYALLRRAGIAAEPARATLRALREVTAEGVGAERIAWGERAGLA